MRVHLIHQLCVSCQFNDMADIMDWIQSQYGNARACSTETQAKVHKVGVLTVTSASGESRQIITKSEECPIEAKIIEAEQTISEAEQQMTVIEHRSINFLRTIKHPYDKFNKPSVIATRMATSRSNCTTSRRGENVRWCVCVRACVCVCVCMCVRVCAHTRA